MNKFKFFTDILDAALSIAEIEQARSRRTHTVIVEREPVKVSFFDLDDDDVQMETIGNSIIDINQVRQAQIVGAVIHVRMKDGSVVHIRSDFGPISWTMDTLQRKLRQR